MVARVVIEDFCGIDHADLQLEPGSTFLVGENNAGKTSVLRALAVAFGARRAGRDDLRRGPGGSAIGPATIDVYLSPSDGSEFDELTRQRLARGVQRHSDGERAEVAAFRTVLAPSEEGAQLTAERRFLQPRQRGAWVESPTAFQPAVLGLVAVHLLDASRDLMDDLGSRGSAWGRVVADLEVSDLPARPDGSEDPLGRVGLEQDLQAIALRIREASPVLTQLEEDLGGLADSQTTVGSVGLVALPARVEELARTIEVVIKQRDATVLPLRFHGLGSRSLASLLVFQTLCSLRVGADQGLRPRLLTLMEEPEAHLHPQAVVALRAIIERLPGQQLITTHSPQLVAEVAPQSVRLVRRSTTGTSILSLPPETAKQMAQFRRFVERPLGEIFFARLVVFGDGTTERNTLPVLLAPLLGCDPGGMGITFVDTEGMEHPKVSKVIEALEALQIPWLVYADNDVAGARALANITVGGVPLDFDHLNVVLGGSKQMEQLLIDAGYDVEIEAVAAESNQPIGGALTPLKFLCGGKGWAAEAVARKAVAAGREAPPPVRDLAEAIHRMIDKHPRALETT
jgi:putative ATP-dependent endonuclease of OLD family